MSDVVTNCSRRGFLRAGAVAAVVGAASALPAWAETEAAQNAAAYAPNKIYITDTIHCKPGDGQALFEHYMEAYVPDALQRGMTLEMANVNPPLWLVDDVASNTLEFTWSVDGMFGWAGMVGAARNGDPAVRDAIIEFWRGVDERCASRTRTLSAADADVEAFSTLANLGA